MKVCSITGCDRTDIQGKDWCRMHYHRWYRTGSTGEAARRQRERRGTCTIDGCNKRDDGPHGLCDMHVTRVRRHGNPLTVNKPTVHCGAEHHSWQGDSIGYNGAHNRVRLRRGSASNHNCVECGTQAEHWAYDHNDPNELKGTIVNSPSLMPYSADPNHYQPMCVKCHKRMDMDRISGDRAPTQLELALAA
jgi:hypothetical protein